MSGPAHAASAAGASPGRAAAPAAGLAGARNLSRHQVFGLALQFLLGMALNLVGLPSQTTGAAHAASIAFLVAHIIVAVALLAGAILIVRLAARAGDPWRRLAIGGTVAIVLTIAVGFITLATSNNWWSFVMAVGFLAALLIYGGFLVRSGAPPAPRNPS